MGTGSGCIPQSRDNKKRSSIFKFNRICSSQVHVTTYLRLTMFLKFYMLSHYNVGTTVSLKVKMDCDGVSSHRATATKFIETC